MIVRIKGVCSLAARRRYKKREVMGPRVIDLMSSTLDIMYVGSVWSAE